MAISLGSLNSTKSNKPPIGVIYAVGGAGKTTLASEFPDPYYVPTLGEEPPEGVEIPSPCDVTKGEHVETIQEVFDVIEWMLSSSHDRKTLIIDSIDGLEPLVWAETCARNGWNNIEDAGFGKGFVAADEVWRHLIGGLMALRDAGIAVVLIGHTEVTRFDSPTSDPYSRYGIKLHKRASALIQEAAQFVGFMNFRHTLKEKDVGFNKKVAHAEGSGERILHLEERPGFLAKSRYSTPASIPYKRGQGWAKLSEYMPTPTGVAT